MPPTCGQDAATWGRYAGKTDEAAFLVNVGRNVSLVKSALMHLPAGYRVAVKPYINRLQILSELAAKGKIDETRLVNAFARREIKREMAEATREDLKEAQETARHYRPRSRKDDRTWSHPEIHQGSV